MTEILHVFGPKFFLGENPEFLEWDYKIQPDSDYVAKFQGDRFRDFGERVAKKDNITNKTYKPVRSGVTGSAYRRAEFTRGRFFSTSFQLFLINFAQW